MNLDAITRAITEEEIAHASKIRELGQKIRFREVASAVRFSARDYYSGHEQFKDGGPIAPYFPGGTYSFVITPIKATLSRDNTDIKTFKGKTVRNTYREWCAAILHEKEADVPPF